MSDTPTEALPDEPAVPEPSPLETVARLAAEAAVRSLAGHGPRLDALEQSVAEIREALTTAAGPAGNAAKLSARLDHVEQGIAEAREAGGQPNPAQQKLIDDLRLKVATLERKF